MAADTGGHGHLRGPHRQAEWTWRPVAGVMAGTALTTAPAWPIFAPGTPDPDALPGPTELVLTLAAVAALPVAWALLTRRARTGGWVTAGLIGCVIAWALWTRHPASRATPPTVDDALRGYLLVAGGIVVAALTVDGIRHRGPVPLVLGRPGPIRRCAGYALLVAGLGAVLFVPVLDGPPTPRRAELLPLPPGVAIRSERVRCAGPHHGCVREFVTAPRTATGADLPGARRELARRLSLHLERHKGWSVRRYPFTAIPDMVCRPASGLANPYQTCVWMREDERTDHIIVTFSSGNAADPILE